MSEHPIPKSDQLEVRRVNAIGTRLAASTCIFRVFDLKAPDAKMDDVLLGFEKESGIIHKNKDHLVLEINHGAMDAFGGLFVLSQSPSIQKMVSPFSLHQEPGHFSKNSFEYAGSNIFHFTLMPSTPIGISKTSGRSFTQDFLSTLIGQNQDIDSIDMCVACDNLNALNLESIGGNSLGIVKVPRKRLENLVTSDRKTWRDFFEKRATHALNAKAPTAAVAPSRVLISSLGELTKLPWFSRGLTPDCFMMFPTPADGAMNILLWSANGHQALTVGFNTQFSSPANDDLVEAALVAWRSLFA